MSGFNKFIKQKLIDKTTDGVSSMLVKMQDNIDKTFQFFVGKPQLDSHIESSVSIVAGENTVPHHLGQTLQGWSVQQTSGPAIIWQTTGALPSKYLYLVSSDPVVVDLLVF